MSFEKENVFIRSFVNLINNAPDEYPKSGLKVGVDLGTANICLAVLDENNNPITGEVRTASVVKDGLVVDYIGSVNIVKELKKNIESRLNLSLSNAAVAVPPGTFGKNSQTFVNVAEACNFNVTKVLDEPSAAATVLGIRNGAVVDVGGGTTGISIIKNKKVIASYDEPTGGGHMTLVLAGHYNIPLEEAEKIKLDKKKHDEIFHIVKPVIEKMATITKRFIVDYNVKNIYLVGGACEIKGFEDVFRKELEKNIYKPNDSMFVTPLGIAMNV